MDGSESSEAPREFREQVQFYLLDHRTSLGRLIDVGLLTLNLVFIAVFVLQTYSFSPTTESLLWWVEETVVFVFTVEYLLRLYGARDRVDEFTDPYTVADLLSILPTLSLVFSPAAVVGLDIGFLRAVRVVRVLRFYRFTRDEEFFFGVVSDETLRVVKLLLTVLSLFFVTAGLFYSAEVDVNPGVETFGDAFYYIVVTLTTVGFGDITPTTSAGRWITVAGIIAAIILVPWQAGKIVREWTNRDRVNVTCPSCGLAYHDPDASHCKSCGHVIYQEFDSRR
ncbi:voltage-gated potassium channel [Halogranum amylolyticum]|uniref:Voltage-gated potassium channel n=1 Tax=Halogranum amylolyticum TaxID=660520 RepID=A0A1H8NHA8_9EURY|nr:ion transporter [Halogranum amylolyticum]SEO28967.1 voltage-gated potassium channel [Halogranum amylolyticum]